MNSSTPAQRLPIAVIAACAPFVLAACFAGERATLVPAPVEVAEPATSEAAPLEESEAAAAAEAPPAPQVHELTLALLDDPLAGDPWGQAFAAWAGAQAEGPPCLFSCAPEAQLPAPGPARRAAAVRLAEALEGREAWAAAGKIWAEAARAEETLAPWFWERAVTAWLSAGELGEAGVALDAWGGAGAAWARAKERVARALLGAGEALEARRAFGARDGAWQGGARETALFAEILEAAGEGEGALRAWEAVYLSAPASPEAARAAEALGARGRQALSPAQRLTRLEGLVAAHDNAQAIREGPALAGAFEAGSPRRCAWALAMGRAYRKHRRYREAIALFEAEEAGCPDPSQRAKMLYLWGAAASIVRDDGAIPVYRRLADTLPSHSFADDALFFISDVHLKAGREDEARALLQEQARRYPEGDYYGEALWRLFWSDWRAGRLEPAEGALGALEAWAAGAEAGEDRRFDLSRARYWGARLAQRRRGVDDPGARLAYAGVFRDFPLTYYGLMAWGQLQRVAPDEAAALVAPLETRPQEAPKLRYTVRGALLEAGPLALGIALLQAGLPGPAAEALGAAADVVEGDDELLFLASLLDRAGDPRGGHRLVRSRPHTFRDRWPQGSGWRLWEVAYPLAFRAEVEAACAPFGVPPDLLQGLIREESALDPQVVSWAGAVGLAQIMPSTARDLARRLGIRRKITKDDLLEPSFNLRLSAKYLRDLLKLFRSNPALAIPSYNAGERTVSGWARRQAGAPLDVFVESISIAETRGYTRRVLESFATYRFLYGDPSEGRVLTLPETVARP